MRVGTPDTKNEGRRRLGPMQTIRHRALRRALAPKARGAYAVARDIPVVMGDGTRLLTDHWIPKQGAPSDAPMVLIRTPYGRDGFAAEARFLAEAGHHVVIQSCRGHWGSGGAFDPLRDERADGFDCVRWLESQPWFPGKIVTYGPSYVGFTQWAIAEGAPDSVTAMVIPISARSFRDSVLRVNGGFGMELCTTWTLALSFMEQPVWGRLRAQLTAGRAIRRGANVKHPRQAARRATGEDVGFYQDWLGHDVDDPWWDPVQYAQDLSGVPPISLVGGWYDMFLHGQVADYEALVAAGRDVRLVLGPWSHMSPGVGVEAMRELWFRLGRSDEGSPVRLQPIGAKDWREYDSWPPPSSAETLHCAGDGSLTANETGADASAVVLRYDPRTPTPSHGGRSLNPLNCGAKNQATREKRQDVLTWTGEASDVDRTIAGEVVAHILSSSSGPSDIFVRLCLVDAKGKSVNLADGYRRLPAAPGAGDAATAPADDGRLTEQIEVSLGPLMARVPAAARLRLQVSGGAHPLHLRHPGNADALHDWSQLRASERQIHCDSGETYLEVRYLADGLPSR